MIILVHILTVLFAISTILVIKKKRYKVMPLICFIIIFSFIGFGSISIFTIVTPFGEILVYPLLAIIGGFLFVFIGINDIYALIQCKEKIIGVYCGYNTYYGRNGVSMHAPVFVYTYGGKEYREQTAQSASCKKLNDEMTNGNTYEIYVNPKHPAVFILSKKMKPSTIFIFALGLFFLCAGIVLFLTVFSMFLNIAR